MTSQDKGAKAPQTVGQAIEYVSAALQNSDVFFGHGTDNPWDEAVQLVLWVLQLPVDADDSLLPHPLDAQALLALQALLQRRISEHVPLPYLLGRAWFAGLEFRCDERAIIPRSPIAELILHDFQPWYCGPAPARILDLCCGGGCIGLAAAYYFPETRVVLVDIDDSALALARDNAALLGVTDRVSIVRSDLFAEVPQMHYDLILSNPPYVSADDLRAMPAEFSHEPANALGSGEDGLDLTHGILASAAPFLSPQGLLIVEVGNSWNSLEESYPGVPFTWIEFERGGHGVFTLSARELQDYSASWRR